MDLNINVEEMTLGQAEFWGEFTGRSVIELKEILDNSEERMTAKDLVALACMSINPSDPEAALPQVRATKVVDIRTEKKEA